MLCRLTIYIGACLFLNTSLLVAQRVYYCEPYSDRFTIREELTAKIGNYYWVETTSRKRTTRHSSDPYDNQERTFDIYNTRMNLVNMISNSTYPGSPIKEYLIAGDDYLDQVHLLGAGKKVGVWLQRYEPDGQPSEAGQIVGFFPFYEPGNSFLLVRSQDRTRILLLGFESLSSSAPKAHALLFDADWHLLSSRVYKHPFITQPTIQDDFTNYPLEDFNEGPVKLANNGDWLMAAPSRTNANFLLFHFNAADTATTYKEIQLPPFSSMEDVDLSIDNRKSIAVAGVLSTFHYETLKSVKVVHYSMTAHSFDFDSSYRLTTLGDGKVKDGNLVKEHFIAVPGRGFMLLKEYGRPFEDWYYADEVDEGWDPNLLFALNSIPNPGTGPSVARPRNSMTREGYARYQSMKSPQDHERGDLSLYYFPTDRTDTCWSGMISKEQVTELNSPNLSYMVVPVNGNLLFLYNSFVHGESLYATSTVISGRGDLVSNEGVPFWGLKKILNFQQSRQISPDQVVVPYDRFGRIGFAVVLLQ